jgi:UDP-glucose 4-epimerase
MRAVITGGNGYFGRILIGGLCRRGFDVVSIDTTSATPEEPRCQFIQGDATKQSDLEAAVQGKRFDVVFHLAALIDFASSSQANLYKNNVEAARAVAELAKRHGIPRVIFISSNSVYLGNRLRRPILEQDNPMPIDAYGRSKVDSERILASYGDWFQTVSIRCPNIMDAGRLGIATILFDFIRESRRCWVIGTGSIRYQCIYAEDLVDACVRAVTYPTSATFNVGSDNVPSFREMYEYVISRAGTKAKVVGVPESLALPLLKAAYRLRLSPLGEYQFRMLTMDFIFDTSKIKQELDWAPTLNNSEMLWKAYEYYVRNREDLLKDKDLSANRQPLTKLGILRLLKLLS